MVVVLLMVGVVEVVLMVVVVEVEVVVVVVVVRSKSLLLAIVDQRECHGDPLTKLHRHDENRAKTPPKYTIIALPFQQLTTFTFRQRLDCQLFPDIGVITKTD